MLKKIINAIIIGKLKLLRATRNGVSYVYVMVVGLNYRTAPVELREKLVFSEETLGIAIEKLKKTKSVLEAVIIGTCNRTEVFAVVDQTHTGEHFIKRFLAEWFNIPKENFIPYLYIKKEVEATEHLFKVASGLDSMILGETQILGQTRQSFLISQQNGGTGTIFNTLFKQAITFAKKTHTELGIGENAVSVSYAAVELLKKSFPSLNNQKVLIIGAGETGELAAIHLHSQGVQKVMVVNRTFSAAQALAATFHGVAYSIEQLPEALVEADIVISSTSSKEIIITHADLLEINKNRHNRPLYIIDIAVPRDIDPEVKQIEGVSLYDIDDLQGIVDANLKEREKQAVKAHQRIDDEVYKFYQWVNTLGVIPLITALREKSLKIQEETMKSIENKLPNLTERERSILRKHTKSIVNQMVKDPIMRLKEMATEPDAEYMMNYFSRIFALEVEQTTAETSRRKKNEALLSNDG